MSEKAMLLIHYVLSSFVRYKRALSNIQKFKGNVGSILFSHGNSVVETN